MTGQHRNVPQDNAASPILVETFSDGKNSIISTQLSLDDFLADEDQKMRSFIKLFQEHCSQGRLPPAGAIPPEKIAATGMMSRTHCLRASPAQGSFRYAVWAQDANFDGYRSLQNMNIGEGSPFPILTEIVQNQLSGVLSHGKAAFYTVRGVINHRYYYFTKAILPLRNEQGEIVKCLVPFTDKLPDIPPDLREEFCAQAVE